MVTEARALPNEPFVKIDPDRWRPALPADVWVAGFPAGNVLRADVFDLAGRWRLGEVPSRSLLAAACAWGYGPVGYGLHRTRTALANDPDGALLDRALAALRADLPGEDDLQRAYAAFRTAAHVRGLGPSFFTKVLYFAGYRRGIGGVQPLILDKVIATRLPPEAGVTSKVFRWRSTEWMSYLRWAAGQGPEPDHVEVALFNV